MSAADYIAQADALVASDLSDAHVDVQSLAATYKARKGGRGAQAFARALVRRAGSAGVKIPSATAKMSKAQLEAEVERRNRGRADDALIVPTGTGSNGNVTKDDLEAALKADDERS